MSGAVRTTATVSAQKDCSEKPARRERPAPELSMLDGRAVALKLVTYGQCNKAIAPFGVGQAGNDAFCQQGVGKFGYLLMAIAISEVNKKRRKTGAKTC